VQVAELEKQNAGLQAELAAGQSAIAEAEQKVQSLVEELEHERRYQIDFPQWSITISVPEASSGH
jgi:hypothetical protein